MSSFVEFREILDYCDEQKEYVFKKNVGRMTAKDDIRVLYDIPLYNTNRGGNNNEGVIML